MQDNKLEQESNPPLTEVPLTGEVVPIPPSGGVPPFPRVPTVDETILYLAWEEDDLDLALVNPKWFVMEAHSLLWQAILKWKADGRQKDLTLFCMENKLGFHHTWQKCNAYSPSPFSWQNYIKELEQTSKQYSVFALTDSLSALDEQTSIDKVCAWIDEYRKIETSKLNVVGSKQYALEYLTDLEQRRDKTKPDIESGFSLLDRMMWGLNRGELITLGGGTSKGKSTFLLNVTLNLIKQTKRVLYFSSEMSVREKWDRLISNLSEVEYYKMRRASFNDSDWTAINSKLSWLHEQDTFWVCDNVGLDITQIGIAVDQVKPDVVIVDYLGLFKMDKSERKDIGISEFMTNLKMMARAKSVCILIASQLNRNVELRNKKIPTLSDIKDSSSIEQESDVVLLLYEDIETPSLEANVRNLKLSIEKNRHGECGLVGLSFNTFYLRMMERELRNEP